MKLDFNKPFLSANGVPLEPPATQSALLSNALAGSNKGDPVKLWTWACALEKEGVLDLDAADLDTLEKFIREYPGGTNALSVAQLLKTISDARVAAQSR